MPVSLPSPFNQHTSYTTLQNGTFGSPTNLGNKGNGGVPITQSGAQWYGPSSSPGGIKYQFVSGGAAQDMTSPHEIFAIGWQTNAPNRVQLDTLANNGLCVQFFSSTTGVNYRRFRVGGQDTLAGKFRSSPLVFVVDPSAPGDVDSGTYNDSSINEYSVVTKKANQAGSNSNWNYITKAVRIGTTKTASNTPRLYGSSVKLADLHAEVFGTTYTDVKHLYTSQLGSAFFLACPFVIGYASQGATTTTFDDEGVSVVSPGDRDTGDPRFHLSTNAMRVYLDLNSSDTVTMSGSYVWGTAAPWDLNSSVGATVTITGTFTGMGEVTLGSDVTCSGTFNLSGSSEVVSNSANVDDIVVQGDMTLNNVQSMTGAVVTGTLTLDAAGTYTFTNCTIGTVANSSGGSITINSSGTTITTNSGPSITIVQNTGLTLTGLKNPTEIRVFDSGTTTEIAGQESVTTGTFATTIDAGSYPSVDIAIISLDYEIERQVGVDLSNGDVTLPIQQRADSQYENP